MTYCAITCTARVAFLESESLVEAAARVSHALTLPEGSRLVISSGHRWKGFFVGQSPRYVLASGYIPDPAEWMARAEVDLREP